MTARTVSAADPVILDAAFEPRPEKAAKSDTNAMMAGSDMYRRMQARPKSSANGYILGGVAAIALIGGGAYFATHMNHAKTGQTLTVAANTANQQAQTSDAAAQAAQKSAQASADAAQAKAVATTGAPPAAATDQAPPAKVTRTVTRTHDTVVHRTVVARQTTRPSASATSSGVDVNAITPAPAPVTATQPTPAPQQAAPPFSVPIPAPAPTTTPAQPTTPPQ